MICNKCNKRIRTGACACHHHWSVVRVLDVNETKSGNIRYYVGVYCKPRPKPGEVREYRNFDAAQRAADKVNAGQGARA